MRLAPGHPAVALRQPVRSPRLGSLLDDMTPALTSRRPLFPGFVPTGGFFHALQQLLRLELLRSLCRPRVLSQPDLFKPLQTCRISRIDFQKPAEITLGTLGTVSHALDGRKALENGDRVGLDLQRLLKLLDAGIQIPLPVKNLRQPQEKPDLLLIS